MPNGNWRLNIKKTEVFEKNAKFLEQKLNHDVNEAIKQFEEVKAQKEKLQKQYDVLSNQHETLQKEASMVKEELAAESAARRQLEESSKEMENELTRLTQKFENEASQLGELVTKERKSRDEFMSETQQMLLEFQKEVDLEKTRRLQILRQLEAERFRISLQKWAKDEEVTSCSNCDLEFTLFRRKHHCRSCGNIFCHDCSAHTALTTAGPKPVRVCDSCYEKIENYDQPQVSIITEIDKSLIEGLEELDPKLAEIKNLPPRKSSSLSKSDSR